MKGKQLLLVLVLLLALGGAALMLRKQSASAWSQSANTSNDKIVSFPLNDITHVVIKNDTGELNLIKKEDGWHVAERADYPADFGKVAGLIRNLWELRATHEIKADPSQFGRLELTEPATATTSNGTMVDLKAGDKRLAALLFGKKYFPDANDQALKSKIATGRYVRSADNSAHVYLISETFEEAQPKPEQWLKTDFLQIANVSSIALAGTSPGMQWKVSRDADGGAWKLQDAKANEMVDPAVPNQMTSYLPALGFSDVLPPDAPPAQTGMDKPTILTVETFDGFTYELRIGTLSGENYPFAASVKATLPNERTPSPDEKPESKANLDQQFQVKQKQLQEKLTKQQGYTTRTYLMPKTVINQFLKDRVALLKPAPSPSPSPAKSRPSPTARPK